MNAFTTLVMVGEDEIFANAVYLADVRVAVEKQFA